MSRSLRRLAAGGGVLAVLAILLASNVVHLALSGARLRPVSRGRAAPGFVLPTPDGERVELAALRGQVVLLSFWASWCGPCLDEMPWLDELQQRHREQGLRVLGINVEGRAERIRAVRDKTRASYTMLVGSGAVASTYGVQTLPHLVLVGRGGQVRYVHVGAGGEEKLAFEVRQALKAGGPRD